MSEIETAVHALLGVGWSEYASKTYTALVLQGTSTASQIANKAGVPTNRIYQILDRLIAKGYVKRIAAVGLTTRYEPKNINDLLDQELKITEAKYNNAIDALVELHERQPDQTPLRSRTIYGGRELGHLMREIIESASNQILFFMDTLVELRYADLIEILNLKSEDPDIVIKLLTSPRGINDRYEREVFEELIDIDLRITEDPLSTILLLKDEQELLFISYAQLTEELTPRDYFGVFLQDQKTIRMFLKIFNLAWESAVLPPE